MYRYLERAENTARLIETGQRLALTRSSGSDDEWYWIMETAGVSAGFAERHETVTKDAAIDWLLRDTDNPASVAAAIDAARQNARMVRTAVTNDVWEATNSAYMEAKTLLARKVSERDLPRVLGRIRHGTSLVRGATHGTMLRNDIYDFARIGTFLERADYTARILDVKYYVLLPSVSAVGAPLDNIQWESILRSVSARGGFRMEYGRPGPKEIAQFLILDRRMPRSLAFCARKLCDNLGYLVSNYNQRPPSYEKVNKLERHYLSHDIDAVFEYGLHEFIQEVLGHLGDLSYQIEIDYRFNE